MSSECSTESAAKSVPFFWRPKGNKGVVSGFTGRRQNFNIFFFDKCCSKSYQLDLFEILRLHGYVIRADLPTGHSSVRDHHPCCWCFCLCSEFCPKVPFDFYLQAWKEPGGSKPSLKLSTNQRVSKAFCMHLTAAARTVTNKGPVQWGSGLEAPDQVKSV